MFCNHVRSGDLYFLYDSVCALAVPRQRINQNESNHKSRLLESISQSTRAAWPYHNHFLNMSVCFISFSSSFWRFGALFSKIVLHVTEMSRGQQCCISMTLHNKTEWHMQRLSVLQTMDFIVSSTSRFHRC
jgi:hypothetical protein